MAGDGKKALRDLDRKGEPLKKLEDSLTPAYLQTATKADLKAKMDEVDQIVKDYDKQYNTTNWAELPPDEITDYEDKKEALEPKKTKLKATLTAEIAKLDAKEASSSQGSSSNGSSQVSKDQTAAIISELTKIKNQLHEEKAKLTSEYFANTPKAHIEIKRKELETLKGTYMTKRSTLNTNSMDEAQKASIEEELKAVNEVGSAITQLITQITNKGGSVSIEALSESIRGMLQEFQTIRADLTSIRTEAVAREALANQKLDKLEKKLDRPIRSTGPENGGSKTIPTTRDDSEFQDSLETQPGTSQEPEQIVKMLKFLKDGIQDMKAARENLTYQKLHTSEKASLERFRGKVDTVEAALNDRVTKLEKMNLSAPQKDELRGYKEAKTTLITYLKTALSDAISVAEEEEDQEDDDPQVGTKHDEIFDMIDAVKGLGGDKPRHHHHKQKGASKPHSNTAPNQQDADPLTIIVEDDTPSHRGNREPGNSGLSVIPLRLETVQLPTFNGDLTEWIGFKDIFTSFVHENPQMNDTLKFHQLRSKLRGAALDTIRGYQMNGTNYAAAWEDLKKRYDRTDNLIQEYIRKFLEVPAIMQKANLPRLRAIVDATNQMVRALPSLGADVQRWDPFITLIVTTKLDEETRAEWKQHVGRRTNTTTDELVEFIETKAMDLQPSEGDKLSQMLKGQINQRYPKRNIFAINERRQERPRQPRRCIICQGDHFPWQCKKLKGECARVRTKMIREIGACFKCLLKHEIGECTKAECPYCGGEHNTLLCFKREKDQKIREEQAKAKANKWPPKTGQPNRSERNRPKAQEGEWPERE